MRPYVGLSGISLLASGAAVPSGPLNSPDGSTVMLPVAVILIRSPRFTITPVLLQLRPAATSAVEVLALGPRGLRVTLSGTEDEGSEVAAVFSAVLVSGSLFGVGSRVSGFGSVLRFFEVVLRSEGFTGGASLALSFTVSFTES